MFKPLTNRLAADTSITANVYTTNGTRPYVHLSDSDFAEKASDAQQHLLGLTMMDMGWSSSDRLLAHQIGIEELARAGRVFDVCPA